MTAFPSTRLRRMRSTRALRRLVEKTRLNPEQFIYPLFVKSGVNLKIPINSMPGQFQFSPDLLIKEVIDLWQLGIKNIFLFGIPEHKDPLGSESFSEHGIIQQSIPQLKDQVPDLLIFADSCFCEYTDHGHCGVLNNKESIVDNDKTLALLAQQAVSQAAAGADVISPSGSMDGMVGAIRTALDAKGFKDTPILSYSIKYASSLYGPFREAAEGAPSFGTRESYQMNYAANPEEALREAKQDVEEGADMLMVKPAHTYLDIIQRVKNSLPGLPLGAYHTSGEFAMLKAAAEKGWVNEQKSVTEVLSAIQRAGADFIISYYAKEFLTW